MAEKIFYTMGEVAEMFDVNTSLIRHWESQFSILRPKRNKKGNRLFSPQDVEHLKMIYHLVKECGMTLDGAKKALRKGAAANSVERDAELMERLQRIRSLLVEVREDLKTDEGMLVDDGGEPGEAVPTAAISSEVTTSTDITGSRITEPAKNSAAPAEASIPAVPPVAPVPEVASVPDPETVPAESSPLLEVPSLTEAPAPVEGSGTEQEPVVRRRRSKPVVRIDEETGREEAVAGDLPDHTDKSPAADTEPLPGQPTRRPTRKPRRKKEEPENKELFAFYEQSLF